MCANTQTLCFDSFPCGHDYQGAARRAPPVAPLPKFGFETKQEHNLQSPIESSQQTGAQAQAFNPKNPEKNPNACPIHGEDHHKQKKESLY